MSRNKIDSTVATRYGITRVLVSGFARLRSAFLVSLVVSLVPSPCLAMDLAGVGPRVGAVDPDGMNGTFAAGVHLDFEEAGSRVHLVPNLMFWDESGLSDVNPNMDVMYHFNPAGAVSPYLGAGVGLHFYSSEAPSNPGTDPSANFFGGILVPSRAMSFFVEGRAVVSDRDQFGVLTGVTLPVAR